MDNCLQSFLHRVFQGTLALNVAFLRPDPSVWISAGEGTGLARKAIRSETPSFSEWVGGRRIG